MDSFEVSLDDKLKLVKVVIKGEVFQNDGEKIITTARQTAAQHNYNIFYDMRAATTTVPFTNWYNLPRELEVFNKIDARKTRVAILVSKTDKALEGYRFYETVTDNLGFKFRIFFNETEALRWLAPNQTSKNQ